MSDIVWGFIGLILLVLLAHSVIRSDNKLHLDWSLDGQHHELVIGK